VLAVAASAELGGIECFCADHDGDVIPLYRRLGVAAGEQAETAEKENGMKCALRGNPIWY
jgi:hypothetical protein